MNKSLLQSIKTNGPSKVKNVSGVVSVKPEALEQLRALAAHLDMYQSAIIETLIKQAYQELPTKKESKDV